jgi:hypothetical protein
VGAVIRLILRLTASHAASIVSIVPEQQGQMTAGAIRTP